jgi:DNA polymerase-3 subunit beta
MRFTCSREKLLGGLQIVSSVVSTRGMKPVYESVLIRSREGGLELMGTDLEVAIRFHLTNEGEDEGQGIVIEEAGALVVPAARLTSILREVKDERVQFVWEQNILSVECEGSRFRIMGLPEEEFPEIPDFPEQTAIRLPGDLFKRMVSRTSFATAKEKMRYALNGILFLLKGTTLTMVGTDGRRLAHTSSNVADAGDVDLRAIVPTKGMTQIGKVLGDEEDTIELALEANQLSARTAHAVVVSRVLEGSFPPFEDVIPMNCERKARVGRDELVAAVRKAALLTNKESQSVRWAFDEGALTLTSRAAEVGEAHVTVDIEYEGEPAEVAFNPAYVLDGLNVIEDATVTFEFRNPSSPAKMTDGEEFTYVVMPISIE